MATATPPLDAAVASALLHTLAQQADANRLGAQLAQFGEALKAGPDAMAIQAATVGLLNVCLATGQLEAGLRLLKQALVHVESAEFRRVESQIARHLALGQLKHTAAALIDGNGHFISAALRPVRAAHCQLVADRRVREAVAIVMQGPLLREHDFTVETLKLYARVYPEATLVLSTWDDEDLSAVHAAALPRLIVCQSAKPALGGPSNINFQLTSAAAGIRCAIERVQPAYILKTRTDMRFYNPNLLADMLALLAAFPLDAAPSHGQQQRLLIVSDVVKYMLHAAPDKNLFGSAHDMARYWAAPLDGRAASACPPNASMREFARHLPPEVYLLRHYLQAIGRPLHETLADHFDVLRDHFVVLDRTAADLYWHKYHHQLEYRFKDYGGVQLLEEFGFNDWLRLRAGAYRLNDADALIDALPGRSINALLA